MKSCWSPKWINIWHFGIWWLMSTIVSLPTHGLTRNVVKACRLLNLFSNSYAGSWDSLWPVIKLMSLTKGPPMKSRLIGPSLGTVVTESLKPSLVVGIPLYGRSFLQTEGIGKPFSGLSQGSWEQGVYDYKALVSLFPLRFLCSLLLTKIRPFWNPQPLEGSHVQSDNHLIASWSYHPGRRELITYDTADIARRKAEWIRSSGLAGGMYWELSGWDLWIIAKMKTSRWLSCSDHPVGHNQAIVPCVANRFGRLDQTPNHLSYPHSKFDNLRDGMWYAHVLPDCSWALIDILALIRFMFSNPSIPIYLDTASLASFATTMCIEISELRLHLTLPSSAVPVISLDWQ